MLFNVFKPYLLLIVLISVGNLHAQQDPQFSQYNLNKMSFNPGFTGIDEVSTVSLLYRDQWLGFDGAPSTQFLSFDTPVEKLAGGLGFSILNDQIASQRTTNLNANYAFRVYWGPKNDAKSLALGVGFHLTQFTVDGGVFRAPDGYYENDNFNHNDNAIPNGIASSLGFDGSAGLYFYSKDYFLGASVTHIGRSKVNIDMVTISATRNLFVMGGYNFRINKDYVYRPSILFKSTLRKSQIDFTFFGLEYNNELWASVGIRGLTNFSRDAWVLNFGVHVTDHLSTAYSYDITPSTIGAYSGGTHEFVIKYRLLNFTVGGQTPEKIYCPKIM